MNPRGAKWVDLIWSAMVKLLFMSNGHKPDRAAELLILSCSAFRFSAFIFMSTLWITCNGWVVHIDGTSISASPSLLHRACRQEIILRNVDSCGLSYLSSLRLSLPTHVIRRQKPCSVHKLLFLDTPVCFQRRDQHIRMRSQHRLRSCQMRLQNPGLLLM